MILVRNTIPHRRIDPPTRCGLGVEVMAVELKLPNLQLTVYNVYRKETQELYLTDVLALASVRPYLVGGDFNAHHPVLNSVRRTNAAGLHVNGTLQDIPLVSLLNTGEATHINGGRLDLTFSSNVIAALAEWSIHPTLVSDHFATVTVLDLDQPAVPLPPPRWNVQKADWLKFQKHVDSWWADYTPSEDLDARAAEFTAAVTAAADEAIPKTNPGRPRNRKWWFNTEEVRKANKRVNNIKKLFLRNPTPANKAFLREMVYQARQVAKEARSRCWLEWCASFNEHTSLGTLWKQLKIATGRPPPRPSAHPHPLEEAERLVTEFQSRSATESLPPQVRRKLEDLQPERARAVEEACRLEDPADVPFINQELEEARKGRSDTASGSDGIFYSMLRYAGPAGDAAYLSLLNLSWRLGRSPESWKEGDIVTVSKRSAPTKLRPLTMLKCPGKMAESMVLARLRWRIGPLHPHLFGFVRGSSTGDCIMALHAAVDHRPAVVVFLDIEKAFELACPDAILEALVMKGVRGRLLAWLRDYLRGRKSRVRFQGVVSEYRTFENGTPQGGILSPFLFNLLMEILVSLLLPCGVQLLSYADDLALVVSGRVANKVSAAQRALDLITSKCEELGFKISAGKSKAMAFHYPETPRQKLRIQDVDLDWVKEHLYLGVWLDRKMQNQREVTHLVERMTARHHVMRAMTNPAAGTSTPVLRSFYVHAIRPLMDYAAPVLVTLTKEQRYKLEVVQRTAMRTILRAPRWTKVETLQAELGLSSLEWRTQQLMAGKVAKALQRNPDSIFRTRLGRLGGYLGRTVWMRETATIFKSLVPHWSRLAAGADEVDPRYTQPPPWEQPAMSIQFTELPGSKRQCSEVEMRQHALRSMEGLHRQGARVYYTDGSVDPNTGRTGSAFVSGALTVGWRNSDRCSTLQTELAAIHGALEHASTTTADHVIVHTDSKAALQTLCRSHRLQDNIALTTATLAQGQLLVAQGKSVTLSWIPSHVGLSGNERADVAAREATREDDVSYNIRPSISHTRTKVRETTVTNMYQHFRQEANTSASVRWYMEATDFQQPRPELLKTRALSSATHRLRLGYVTAGERFVDRVPADCRHCGEPDERPLEHYLLRCPETDRLRQLPTPPGEVPPDSDTMRAAALVKRACEEPDVLRAVLLEAPPPR